jgi:hypothetical protein
MLIHLKKFYLVIKFLVVIIFISALLLLYRNYKNQGQDYYIEKFNINKEVFNDIVKVLAKPEYDFRIYKESEKTIIIKNGENTLDVDALFDEETKDNIINVINDLELSRIDKFNKNLEFVYKSKKDQHSIVYSIDKNEINSYTEVKYLGDNWYYCFRVHE